MLKSIGVIILHYVKLIKLKVKQHQKKKFKCHLLKYNRYTYTAVNTVLIY